MSRTPYHRDDPDHDHDHKPPPPPATRSTPFHLEEKRRRGAPRATPRDTTDVEDQEALAAAILELIQAAEYDDMTWAEVDNALRLVSHNVKINWADSGSVEPAPAGAVDGVMRRRAA